MWAEFFKDDTTGTLSMNRLATFMAINVLSIGFICILIFCFGTHGSNLQGYLGALTTLGIIIAGLGGFNYAAGRAAGAYTQVRMEQARQGIPAPDVAPLGPTTLINVGQKPEVIPHVVPPTLKKKPGSKGK